MFPFKSPPSEYEQFGGYFIEKSVFNAQIIIGSLCSFLTIFLLSIDTRVVSVRRYEQICYAKIWILCFGFTLAFGSMFSKTYRVQ